MKSNHKVKLHIQIPSPPFSHTLSHLIKRENTHTHSPCGNVNCSTHKFLGSLPYTSILTFDKFPTCEHEQESALILNLIHTRSKDERHTLSKINTYTTHALLFKNLFLPTLFPQTKSFLIAFCHCI